MTVKLGDSVDAIKNRRTINWIDHFDWYVTAHRWTSTLTDSGTATVNVTTNGAGIALAMSDGTVADNDEAYLSLTNKTIVPTANKSFVVEATVQFTEANTDDANIIFGISSSIGANALVDDGAGPPSNYTGLVFFKTDGDTVWQCESSVGTTQTTTRLTAETSFDKIAKTAGGATDQRLRIEYVPYSSTKATVSFIIDGVTVAQHDWTYTSAAACGIIVGGKNGGANLETLNVRYVALEAVK